MTMQSFHLLTGPPGSGKSALLLELRALGHTTVNEPARQILAEQRSFGGNGLPERNPALFTELVLSRAIVLFEQMKDIEGPVFFDRGVPDHAAYAALFEVDSAAAELRLTNSSLFVGEASFSSSTRINNRKSRVGEPPWSHASPPLFGWMSAFIRFVWANSITPIDPGKVVIAWCAENLRGLPFS